MCAHSSGIVLLAICALSAVFTPRHRSQCLLRGCRSLAMQTLSAPSHRCRNRWHHHHFPTPHGQYVLLRVWRWQMLPMPSSHRQWYAVALLRAYRRQSSSRYSRLRYLVPETKRAHYRHIDDNTLFTQLRNSNYCRPISGRLSDSYSTD